MSELLLEIFSEEIPARMQAKAEADLLGAVEKGLKEAGLDMSCSRSMSGPRRLAVVIEGLPKRSADVEEERKGPKVGAPEQAVAGFLRGAGLSDISQAEIRSDPKKGDFYVAVKKIVGRDTSDIVADLVPGIIRNFHWPKSMRTGRGELRWVRPIQGIVCVFDGAVVPFEIDGHQSGNVTEGHRVHGRGPYTVTNAAEYEAALSGDGHVMLTREARREKIETEAKAVCAAAGLELVEDKGLLEEVVGLAEWPSVVLGEMDPSFLTLPPEVIQLSMRTHQKYFAVRDPKTGELAPNFVVVANIAATDGGTAIAKGNRKVLSARLDDGRFFWDNDRSKKLGAFIPKLGAITFKEELGSLLDKTERVHALARELAPKVGADPDLAGVAAKLAKADLTSEMVYEFPELQGVMGRYYALAEAGLDPLNPSKVADEKLAAARPYSAEAAITVADAIRDHYKPQGPSDAVPTDPVGIAVALADKLDTLVGFWAIDEKPTGSKDPFALRRAALGVVRILLENGAYLPLRSNIFGEMVAALIYLTEQKFERSKAFEVRAIEIKMALRLDLDQDDASFDEDWKHYEEICSEEFRLTSEQLTSIAKEASVKTDDLLSFFADRLKQYLRDQGQRHDLIDAVFALGEDDLVLITRRVEALGAFLETEDGANLLAGYKRAANILKAEEKKDKRAFDGDVDTALFEAEAEKALYAAMGQATTAAKTAIEAEDFAAAMSALASLRGPVDAFFDGEGSVMVNADDPKIRENRLNLLNQMRAAISTVADFSKVSG
ncbi:glycine--tRNA ligase subunit beta [Hyphomonas sp. FCG-A18]|uniref:glycine--tRNA ligase subunit beta n=1 Tax=Hyphomonas sp. FCG-A18 TaxID=3080019 RepID=UPI002B2FB054|nr:glycine--tRNA ligase subunit beta [Hyphomonas sp. FCG-A18]